MRNMLHKINHIFHNDTAIKIPPASTKRMLTVPILYHPSKNFYYYFIFWMIFLLGSGQAILKTYDIPQSDLLTSTLIPVSCRFRQFAAVFHAFPDAQFQAVSGGGVVNAAFRQIGLWNVMFRIIV